MPQSYATLDDTRSLLEQADVLLLDYNGTLSNDEELCAELISEVSEDHLGLPVSRQRYFDEFAGVTEEAVYGRLTAEAGGADLTPYELMREFNRRYLERFRSNSTITREAADFVRTARTLGKRLMVVTAASREVVVPAVEIAGLGECFEGIVGLEDVAASKPTPECYLRAVEQLGAEPSRTVAFEDSRTGLTAALGAGLATVGILGSLDRESIGGFTPHIVDGLHPHLLEA
ncbi:HAD family hydrolase [Leucobacter ruminantium]|uniref:HAD family phosphatase n=1 Tax=Leucobacter ruminantium TaxID=1289170 RepID=A0A939RWL7_9MICO|nr:HAD family phosphatase [Leucobacter ruminantium]MBO1803798.1 HAD family phosphatase [Leucobacter ruminantium]